MTLYADLVNVEIGNATNYGSHFKTTIELSLETVKAFKKHHGKRKFSQLLRVYIAGSMETGNTHLGHFTTGLNQLIMSVIYINSVYKIAVGNQDLMHNGWTIESLNVKEIRENEDWTHPKFLIDWLLESDFHVILCQGIHNGMLGVWLPVDCQKQVLRLQDHPGFPTGINVFDPVINADKFQYLCAASQYCLPSFKVPLLQDDQKMTQVMKSLKIFMKNYLHYDGVDQGFILKAPFVQNQRGFKLKYFKTYEEFINILWKVYTSHNTSLEKTNVLSTSVFPYLILQPRMASNKESKIVLWNGKAQFISCIPKGKCGLTGIKTREELMKFAEEACKYLKERTRNAFLCDGITRVDLFCTINGNLIVNE